MYFKNAIPVGCVPPACWPYPIVPIPRYRSPGCRPPLDADPPPTPTDAYTPSPVCRHPSTCGPQTDKREWKHKLRKLRLPAVITGGLIVGKQRPITSRKATTRYKPTSRGQVICAAPPDQERRNFLSRPITPWASTLTTRPTAKSSGKYLVTFYNKYNVTF